MIVSLHPTAGLPNELVQTHPWRWKFAQAPIELQLKWP